MRRGTKLEAHNGSTTDTHVAPRDPVEGKLLTDREVEDLNLIADGLFNAIRSKYWDHLPTIYHRLRGIVTRLNETQD